MVSLFTEQTHADFFFKYEKRALVKTDTLRQPRHWLMYDPRCVSGP